MAELPSDFMTAPVGKAAELLVEFYDDSRLQILRSAPWTCVAKRAALTADTVQANLTGRSLCFDPPTDFVREIDMVDATGQPIDFLFEAGHFYTNAAEPILIYVPDSEDPTAWDPLLREAIITQLAAAIAYPLTGSHENEMAFSQVAAGLVEAATTTSLRERRQRPSFSDPYMADLFPARRPK